MSQEVQESFIVFCPCCVTNLDVEGEGWHEEECRTCTTRFKVFVDPQAFATHAI